MIRNNRGVGHESSSQRLCSNFLHNTNLRICYTTWQDIGGYNMIFTLTRYRRGGEGVATMSPTVRQAGRQEGVVM